MFQKKILISETDHLEQVFVDGQLGLFQAGIMLTNFSIYLFENSRETYAKNRHSLQYQINFQDIIDIRLRSPQEFQEEVFRLPKTSQLLADPCFQKKTCHVLRLYFRDTTDQRDCDILSNANSCIHRQIIAHWQSSIQIETLGLVDDISESQYTPAHAYYTETLSSLKNSSNISEQTEILREFGQEIITDVMLKKICFTSRELVIILFNFCDLVISPPNIQSKSIKSYYDEKRMRETQIQQRLELFHSVLNVLYSLFFVSECLDRRFDIICGSMSPLILQSWIDITTLNFQKQICLVFNYSFTHDTDDLLDEVDFEIDASFDTILALTPRDIFDTQHLSPVVRRTSFNERLRTNSFDSPRLRSRTNSISRANSICRTNSIDNVSSDLLTPLRKRIQNQLAEQKMKKSLNLTAIVQSIRDLQILLASNICNSIFIGRPILRSVDTSPLKNYAEIFLSHLDWEEFLEDVLIRISDILDDMLALESIATRVKRRLRNKILQKNDHLYNTPPKHHHRSDGMIGTRDRVESDASDLSPVNVSYVIEEDRKRVPPSPTKQNGSKRDGQIKKSRGEEINNNATIFETQENLLFNACNFLYLLFLESPRIRYYLSIEMEGAWFGIMHSLNLIIPRPDEDNFDQQQQKQKQEMKSTTPSSPSPPLSPSGKKLKFLKDLFQSEPEPEDEIIDSTVNISIKERNLLYPPLLLKEYGRPAYKHLSRGSWELILISRCYLEEMIKSLGLEVSLVSNLPIPDEEQEEELNLKSQRSNISNSWTLDPTIPISRPPPNNSNQSLERQLHVKALLLKDPDLPEIHQSDSPRMKLPPSGRAHKTIQERLDSHTPIPYHTNNEHRIRKFK